MDSLVRVFAQPIGFCGMAFAIAGAIYLGVSLASGHQGKAEMIKALAMICAGLTVAVCMKMYGYTGL